MSSSGGDGTASVRRQFQANVQQHARYWLQYWRANGHDVAVLRTARGHALRSLTWCLEGHYFDLAADLALVMHTHMVYAGHWSEWEPCLRQVVEVAGPRLGTERRLPLRHLYTSLLFRLYRLDEAVALALEDLEAARSRGDASLQHDSLTALAEAHLNAERFDLALDFAEQAAELGRTLGWCAHEADGHIGVARALMGLGEIHEAERRLRRAHDLATGCGHRVYVGKALLFLGHAAGARTDWAAALAFFENALAVVSALGDEVGRGVVLSNAGRALTELGRYDEAEAALLEGLEILGSHGNGPAEVLCRRRLAHLAHLRMQVA